MKMKGKFSKDAVAFDMNQDLISKQPHLDEENPSETDDLGEKKNDCCPQLPLKHRVIIFLIFNIIGYAMQIGGFTRLLGAFYSNTYHTYVLVYTLGRFFGFVLREIVILLLWPFWGQDLGWGYCV